MKVNIITPDWREKFAPEESQDLGNGMFSPTLRYMTDRIYLFGAIPEFKSFFACNEAINFAYNGSNSYNVLYIQTEMSYEAVTSKRFSQYTHVPENLYLCDANTLEEVADDTTAFDQFKVIILDATCDDGLGEESEPDDQPDLTWFIKVLSNYRMKHPDKMILVYAPLVDRCNTRKEFVDACFTIKRDGIKCTKDRCLDWRGPNGEQSL